MTDFKSKRKTIKKRKHFEFCNSSLGYSGNIEALSTHAEVQVANCDHKTSTIHFRFTGVLLNLNLSMWDINLVM